MLQVLFVFSIVFFVSAQAPAPVNGTSDSTTTTTTTATTTTTTIPTRPWSMAYFVDTEIHRFLNLMSCHHYVASDVELAWFRYHYPTAIKEESVGHVISEAKGLEAQRSCGKPLKKITRFERTSSGNRVSLFAEALPTDARAGLWQSKEVFYCAANRNDCGANYELVLFPSLNHGGSSNYNYDGHFDLFYPSNWGQSDVMRHSGMGAWSRTGIPICYLWK